MQFVIVIYYEEGDKMLALYMSFIDSEDDKDKFEFIYNEYRKRMVITAFSILNNKEDAEDAVHDTFIRIARNMKAIDDPRSEKTLAYVIKATKNNALNLLNKNKKKHSALRIDSYDYISDDEFFEKLSIEQRYDEVVKAIKSLNETYRDVMYYHFVCDMKINDVADLLGEKKSAVQQRLIRGKKKLLEILDDDLRD